MKPRSKIGQRGVSLTGLIFGLAVVAMAALLALKIVPSFTEYSAIKKAIANAKAAGTTPMEIRSSFDKHAQIDDIKSISGKDLELVSSGTGMDVSFAYQKVIPLAGPASLLIDYEGSTAPRTLARKRPPAQ